MGGRAVIEPEREPHGRAASRVMEATPLVLVVLVALAFLARRALVLSSRSCQGPEWFQRTKWGLVLYANTTSEFHFVEGHWPRSLDEATRWHPRPVDASKLDAWGRPYVFLAFYPCGCEDDCSGQCRHGMPVCLGTLGSDGELGGTGEARDRWACDVSTLSSPK